ncbi:MAG: (d)CMP kinase [Thermoguttaceae bacterium]|nr:(d)CMP kinase [Thermoguttaceae bacterium]
MIVTMDGPAGAGKSTVARCLADALGFEYLNTGAMYRGLAWFGLQQGVDWQDADAIGRLGDAMELRIVGLRTFWGETDITDAVRTPEVTAVTHFTADHPRLREILADFQRRCAAGKNIVTEGRDQGSFVFPEAECKIYLTATPKERAWRRIEDMVQRGMILAGEANGLFDSVFHQMVERDRRDEQREIAPLCKAADAIEVVTDGLLIEQVVQKLVQIVSDKKQGLRG